MFLPLFLLSFIFSSTFSAAFLLGRILDAISSSDSSSENSRALVAFLFLFSRSGLSVAIVFALALAKKFKKYKFWNKKEAKFPYTRQRYTQTLFPHYLKKETTRPLGLKTAITTNGYSFGIVTRRDLLGQKRQLIPSSEDITCAATLGNQLCNQLATSSAFGNFWKTLIF